MRYLFAASLGPVQGFIYMARATRDFWYGSWLLSEVSKAGAKSLHDEKATLIFPSPQSDLRKDSATNVANKIIAVVTADSFAGVETLAMGMSAAMRERLKDRWQDILRQLKDAPLDGDAARDQISDLLEINWCAVEFPDEREYALRRQEVEALLAARKTTRTYAAATWGKADRAKSSLDGQRESVLPKGSKGERHRSTYGARRGEELSAIDLLKRLGRRESGQQHFLTTTHMAVLPIIHRFGTEQTGPAAEAWRDYITTLRGIAPRLLDDEQVAGEYASAAFFGNADGTLFFADRVIDELPDGTDPATIAHHTRAIRASLGAFYKAAQVGQPNPYYAILVADGDGMGTCISALARAGYERHSQLSQALDDFATAARAMIRAHEGAPIFTGGDDVVALLPLHTALSCAAQLATAFRAAMQPFMTTLAAPPTLSAGIGISHYLTPLTDAMALARTAESAAKGLPDKNALAVTVSKRSGGETTVRGHWGAIDSRIATFIEWHLRDLFPDGAAYELRALSRRFPLPREKQDMEQIDRLRRVEAWRILRRKAIAAGERANVLNELRVILRITPDDALLPFAADAVDIDALADMLIVARLFAQVYDQAGITPAQKVMHDELAH